MITIASQEVERPLASVAVRVTIFSPRFSQVKVSRSILKSKVPQLEKLPPSMSSGVIIAIPSASSCTVISIHIAVGGSSLTMVTIASQVEVSPLLSVTVRTTILSPIFSQVNVSLSIERVISPQLSVLPPSTSSAVMVVVPS